MPLATYLTMRKKSKKSHSRKVTLTLYSVTRCYGGPEEGGWWYDWYEHVRSFRPMKPCRVERVQDREDAKMGSREKTRHLSNGGEDLVWMTEAIPGEFRSTERPHYE